MVTSSEILKELRETEVSRIVNLSDADLVLPNGLSFFDPYLHHSVKEILEAGGEAFLAKTPEGCITGLFIYDGSERTGTLYTRSRKVFDYFYESKPFSFLWAELKTEHPSETYDIYTLDFDGLTLVHRFRHEISIADADDIEEIERLMFLVSAGMNRLWVKVAVRNGDTCFLVRLNEEIAGLAWVSMVSGIGRLNSLYVKPQFRRMGIGEDLLFARLLWLRSKQAHSAFSEISSQNITSSRIAAKGQMKVSGQVYEYFKDNSSEARGVAESKRVAARF